MVFRQLLFAVTLAGCVAPGHANVQAGTGLIFRTDRLMGADVVGFHLEIVRAACDGEIVQAFETAPNIESGDVFIALAHGCYEVTASPASLIEGDAWTASADCTPTASQWVEVVDGRASEVRLVSQCADSGGSGSISMEASLNHAPTATVEFDLAEAFECEPVTVCATATDVDDDPLAFSWSGEGGTEPFSILVSEAELIGYEGGEAVWESCAEIAGSGTETYVVSVDIHDLTEDGTPLEDLVSGDSHARQLVFLQTEWGVAPRCWDKKAKEAVLIDGYDEVERVEGCPWTSLDSYVCSGDDLHPEMAERFCDEHDGVREKKYWPSCDAL